MGLTSTNTLPKSTVLERVFEVIGWLGYDAYEIDEDIPGQVGSYGWSGNVQFESFVGIELQVYQKKGIITVDTRTRAGRSYWDLKQQNKTIKALRDFFGGSFIADEGKNVLFEEDEEEPTLLESGLYLQKWIHHNDIAKLHIVKMNSQISGNPNITGIPWVDDMNAKVIFNNLQIPYLVGVWEKYLKSTFVVLLRCSSKREAIFKKLLNKTRLLPNYMESFSQNNETVEWLLSEWLSFQRPKAIIENYQIIDSDIDINSAFMKPIAKQKQSLFEIIDHVIDVRNDIAHAGTIMSDLSDDTIGQYIKDFDEAAYRIYHCLGDYYHLHLNDEF